MKKSNLHPGWKLTKAQIFAGNPDGHTARGGYFYWVKRVVDHLGRTDQDAVRNELHIAAFGEPRSAKEINHLEDFDDFKAAVFAVLFPDNVDLQMRQAEMKRTRRIVAIRKLAPEAYIQSEAGRKFHTEDWTTLNESDLTMLRNHLAKRAAGIRWPAQASARKAERVEHDEREMAMAGGPCGQQSDDEPF